MKIQFQSETGNVLNLEFDDLLFGDNAFLSLHDYEHNRDMTALIIRKDAMMLASFIIQQYGGQNG